MSSNQQSLEQLPKISHQKILVVGDLMLDQWMWGKVARISPEAPVPVVDVSRTTYTPGGAANVVCNLLTLGCQVVVGGIIGDDATGDRLEKLLNEHGAGTQGLQRVTSRRTTVKTRIIAHSQQVVRVDQEDRDPFQSSEVSELVTWLLENCSKFDGVFLSDYNKGLFTSPEIVDILPRLFECSRTVVAGPKPENIPVFKGVDCLTLNAKEATEATGIVLSDAAKAEEAGLALLEQSQAGVALITQGEKGMTAFQKGHESKSEPAFATEVFDVSGAGDTVLSVVGLGLCAGLSVDCCISLASHAAAVVVRKLGTATLTVDEIAKSLRERR